MRQAQILRSYLERRSPYVHLLDGGISDNLGLRFSFERVIEEGGLGEMLARTGREATREIVVIVVNAETEGDIRERSGWIEAGLTSLFGIISAMGAPVVRPWRMPLSGSARSDSMVIRRPRP